MSSSRVPPAGVVAGAAPNSIKKAHNGMRFPYCLYEKSHSVVDLEFRRRTRDLFPYGISSTLRKFPVVFHPDRHSCPLIVRMESTCMSCVPAGMLKTQAI